MCGSAHYAIDGFMKTHSKPETSTCITQNTAFAKAKIWTRNKEKKKLYDKQRRQNKKEALREYERVRGQKRKSSRREYKRLYNRRRMSEDVQFLMVSRLRNRIYTVLDGRTKSAPTLKLLGCSLDELKTHLESLFLPGMSWENRSQWHIDHKRPCASFDLTDPEQQKQCFHYTNLQPLWARDNLLKSDSYERQLAENQGVLDDSRPPDPDAHPGTVQEEQGMLPDSSGENTELPII